MSDRFSDERGDGTGCSFLGRCVGDGKPGGVNDTADGVAQKPRQPGEMDRQEPCESQGRET